MMNKMNKKLVITYILSAVLVVYIINVYRSRQSQDVVSTPAATTPAADVQTLPNNKEAEEKRAHNEALIKQYTEQLKTEKDATGDVHYQRGLIYLELEQYKNAIEDFTASLSIVPDSSSALYARALAYQGEDKLELALDDLNASIKAKSDFVVAYNTRAAIYDKLGKTDEAINDYKNAIAIDPNFDQSYFNLGTIYQKQKQYADALTEYNNAISHNTVAADATPKEIADSKKRLEQARMNIATVYTITNDLQNALKEVNLVIESDSKNESAYRLRSEIYNKMGNTVEGLADAATADNLSIQNLLEK